MKNRNNCNYYASSSVMLKTADNFCRCFRLCITRTGHGTEKQCKQI